MNHFNPGLGVGDRTCRHDSLRGVDLLHRAYWAGVAVAAWPVRAA